MNINEISNVARNYLQGLQPATVGATSPTAPGAASLQTLFTQIQTDLQLNSKDFKALKAALKANDLPAASRAFAALQQDFQNIAPTAGVPNPLDPTTQAGKDFQALGAALNAGNLTAAQQSLAAFRQDMGGVAALKGLYQDGAAAVNANSRGQGSLVNSALAQAGGPSFGF
jgi:hypothetical protein